MSADDERTQGGVFSPDRKIDDFPGLRCVWSVDGEINVWSTVEERVTTLEERVKTLSSTVGQSFNSFSLFRNLDQSTLCQSVDKRL